MLLAVRCQWKKRQVVNAAEMTLSNIDMEVIEESQSKAGPQSPLAPGGRGLGRGGRTTMVGIEESLSKAGPRKPLPPRGGKVGMGVIQKA